jgi:hypothetical protein
VGEGALLMVTGRSPLLSSVPLRGIVRRKIRVRAPLFSRAVKRRKNKVPRRRNRPVFAIDDGLHVRIHLPRWHALAISKRSRPSPGATGRMLFLRFQSP